MEITRRGRKLFFKIGFYPTDWGWLWKWGCINFGPLGLWWITGKSAKDIHDSGLKF